MNPLGPVHENETFGSVVIDGHKVFTGVSIGIALSTANHDLPDDLLRDADLAMYRAKNGGKASYAVFDGLFQQALLRYLTGDEDALPALTRRAAELLPKLIA